MRLISVFTTAAFVLLFTPCLFPQEILTEIDLDDGSGAPDYAFGMKLSPDGAFLYAAISGNFSSPNNRLVVIDTGLDILIDEGYTGLYPEEIEFKLDSHGDIELIFVSNSSDHTVTVLNSDLTHHGTVELVQPGSTAYPFGLIMGPLGRYLHVSSVNAGEIFVIDTHPGPAYLEVVQTHYVAAFNGRLARYGDKLVIPGSDLTLGAVLSILDLNNPFPIDTVVLDSETAGWPGANDVVVSNDGFAYVTVLDYNDNPLLYEVDLDSSPPAVSRIFDLSVKGPRTTLEFGIGASPDGNTLVITYLEDAYIKMVGRKTGCVLDCFYVDPTYYGQINEAQFTMDGKKVYLSNQSRPLIHVLDGVPEHGLLLKGEKEVMLGGTATLDLCGGETGQPGLLLLSLTLGPIVAPTFEMDIGLPYWILSYALFDGNHDYPSLPLTCPKHPGLPGTELYFQGLTRDMDMEFRPSNLHTVTIL